MNHESLGTEQLGVMPYVENGRSPQWGLSPPTDHALGTHTLRVPRILGGKFSKICLPVTNGVSWALVPASMEMVVNGVFTAELCVREFSKSTVSELCKKPNPIVSAWSKRPLEAAHPFVLVDAIMIKMREEGRVCSRGVLIPSE